MNDPGDENMKKIKFTVYTIFVLLCTIIGSYGIINAPESDQTELEQELTRNEQLLMQENSDPDFSTEAEQASVLPEQRSALAKAPDDMISVIGDSVFLGASPSFKKLQKNVVIDAKISRQVCQGLDVAKKLDKKNKLGNIVIISLGTNGNFNPVTGQELIDYIGTDRTIFWINAYGKELDFQKEVNHTIREMAKKNKNVHLIPWADEAKKHPDWFYQDGIHLNPKGQEGFAKFIQKEYNVIRNS